MNARFQFAFPVNRVSGPNRKQYVLPDIGIRATQGHSLRDDAGPGYLMAAQERLNADQQDLPSFVFTEQTLQPGEALKHLTHLSQVALLATERLFILP